MSTLPMRYLTLSVLIVLLLSTSILARKPNILLIMADDLGAENLACYGNTVYSASNLDRLATEGARFENAFSTPARTSHGFDEHCLWVQYRDGKRPSRYGGPHILENGQYTAHPKTVFGPDYYIDFMERNQTDTSYAIIPSGTNGDNFKNDQAQ